MYVIKRNKSKVPVKFDKISIRIQKLLDEFNIKNIDPAIITQKLSTRIFSGINTSELDNLASQICMNMVTEHPDFGRIGGLITISNHQKNTSSSFLDVINQLRYDNRDVNGKLCPIINDEIFNLATKYSKEIDKIINHGRDYLLDFFGFKTLEKSYLLKINTDDKKQKIVERPQHLFMRVALCIHGEDLENVKKTYDGLSLKSYTMATPTLFNSGLFYEQLSSCFLTGTEDSVEGIFQTITECAKISKWSGGIGVHVSNIRAKGSYIRKTSGTSDGILPMLKVYNDTARYINQGGGKRNGSFAIYLEPWHADVFDFLEARKNVGAEEERARDLFYAMWIPDLFMECVEQNKDWYLMCPNQSPNLTEVYGEEFNNLYNSYVDSGKFVKKIKARELWDYIITLQIEQGMPYMCYKDNVNRKNNQMNIGIIKSSNLCAEIVEYSDKDEIAVCNLGSICLQSVLEYSTNYDKWLELTIQNSPKKDQLLTLNLFFSGKLKLYSKEDCVYCKLLKSLLRDNNLEYEEIGEEEAEKYMKNIDSNISFENVTVPQLFSEYKENIHQIGGYNDSWNVLKPKINYEKLSEIAYNLCINLNKVIDRNYYPVEKCRKSNFAHRPIGIGVQGLADLFFRLKIPFESEDASIINKKIFETIYYGAINSSIDLAEKLGFYDTYKGSPLSDGKFQFNLWGLKDEDLSGMYDWNLVREKLLKYGVRNSLLVALMPTASTSQIMGSYVECFEAQTSNLYTRRTLAGEFTIINPYLVKDLIDIDIWNEDVKDRLIYDRGSVQKIRALPKFLKDIYKTVYEISQKNIITMSADRGPFVCQSQSLNLFFESPNLKILTQSHFLGWKKGLKTGMYYCRSKPVSTGQKFGLDVNKEKRFNDEDKKFVEEEECLSCGA
jgi:ribonucleoside-diphosphate reductase alpha subunit